MIFKHTSLWSLSLLLTIASVPAQAAVVFRYIGFTSNGNSVAANATTTGSAGLSDQQIGVMTFQHTVAVGNYLNFYGFCIEPQQFRFNWGGDMSYHATEFDAATADRLG